MLMLMLMIEYNPTTKKLFVRGVFDTESPMPERLAPDNAVQVFPIRLDVDNADRFTILRGVNLRLED